MQLTNWLVFCSVALVVTFTPGPGVLLAISNSIAVGPRRAMISSLGNAAGLIVISCIAMAGMGVVLATSAMAFMALKVCGAAYLIFLGIKQWRSKASALSELGDTPAANSTRTPWRLFGQGLTVALTNPKAILFFSALFPQFLTLDAPMLGQFNLLTITFVTCAILSHTFYVLLARVLKNQFSSPRRMRWFNYASGGVFVLLGLSMLRLRNKVA
jgi:threonine/homoserine/homoserine lactone efflux protein